MSKPPPLRIDRAKRLKALCIARVGGDRESAKPFYIKMRELLKTMKEETQDQVLEAMERGLASLGVMGLIPKTDGNAAASNVLPVLASIMEEGACAGVMPSLSSATVVDSPPQFTNSPASP